MRKATGQLLMLWSLIILTPVLFSCLEVFASSLSFAPRATFEVGGGPIAVAVGDFNRDGKPDVAVSHQYGSGIAVLLGDGSGTLGTPTFFAVQAVPKYLAIGDFNHDGALDLAVPNYGSNSVSILLGDGMGSFAPAAHFPAGDGPNGLAVGDFDRDGNLDVVVTNTTAAVPSISILLGDGAGGLGAPATFPVGFGGPIGIAVADLNNDGKLDVAVAGTEGGVSVLLGDGLGGFGSPTNLPTDGDATWVAVGDVNLDGALDLVAVNEHETDYPAISILLGNGLGGFSAPTHFPTEGGGENLYVTVGDFNRDCKPDLAVAKFNHGSVGILLGDGSGSFQTPVDFAVGGAPNAVVAEDLNGDRQLDLVSANFGGGSVSVRVNTTMTIPNGTPIAPIVCALSSVPAAVGDSVVIAIGSSVSFSAPWTDPNVSDTHTAACSIVDVSGATAATAVAGAAPGSGSGTATCNVTFSNTGIFSVMMTVTDQDEASGTSTAIQVVVYDPSASFVSGGGWFTPDPQTCVCTPGSKATFGLVSKYKKGSSVPTGNQEFQYKADNINLHSTSFDWLVVSGPQAQFQGTGTINGAGVFKFRVTVRDGDLIGQPDRFEIRILPAGNTDFGGTHLWKGGNDLTGSNGAGSIVIHR